MKIIESIKNGWLGYLLVALLVLLFLLYISFNIDAEAKELYVLPDPSLTPGVVTDLTKEEICEKKWGHDRRFVSDKMKKEVAARYAFRELDGFVCKKDKFGRVYEIDHLVSRENGGADAILNLWPQCYSGPWNALMKDRVENRLHKEMCLGNIDLWTVQQELMDDWRKSFIRYFGKP